MRVTLAIGLLFCLASAALAQSAPDRSRSSTPIGDPASWISNRDYPAAALRAGQKGTVKFALAIGPDGKPTGCKVTQSSGFALLDETTCRLVVARAQFAPAMDRAGKPLSGSYSSAVKWAMPSNSTISATLLTISGHVDIDGKWTDCRVESAEGLPAFKSGPTDCPASDSRLVDKQGKPIAGRIIKTTDIRIVPDGPG